MNDDEFSKKQEPILKTSLLICNKGTQPYIYEEIYDPERKKHEFIGFPINPKIKYDSFFERFEGEVNGYYIYSDKEKTELLGVTQHCTQIYNDDNIKTIPIDDEEIRKGVVCLPSEIKFFSDEKELDLKIINFLEKWLDISDEYKYIAVQNIKSFWLYDKFETINYLRALGDTGTGKSRFLHTFGFLSYKPLFCSGATTVSPIFRLITKWGGTVIIDEADLKKTDESEDFIKLLNQGYEKNASILRCNPNDKTKIDFFNPYCPKIIATRRTFDDKAVESRCMTTLMHQTLRKDIPFNLNKAFYQESLEIRNMLLYYRFINYGKINVCFSELPEIKKRMANFEPRLQQVNNILLCLFWNNPEQLETFFKYMEHKQKETIKERSESFEGWIVNAIAELIIERITEIYPYPYISSQDIATRLNQNEGRQYHEYNNRSIGRYLKTLGFFVSPAKRLPDGTIKKIILWEKSKQPFNIFERYVFDVEILTKLYDILIKFCNIVTCVTVVVGHRKNVTSPKKPEKNQKNEGAPYDVTTVTNVTSLRANFDKNNEILEFFETNKGQNKDIFIKNFGEEKLNDLLKSGCIYEPKHLELRLLDGGSFL